MRAGTLRERITLQRPQQDDGQEVPDYADVYIGVRARVVAASAAESTADKGVVTAVNYDVSLRWLPDVTGEWRIVWAGRVLDLLSVIDPTGYRAELVIKAVENVTHG